MDGKRVSHTVGKAADAHDAYKDAQVSASWGGRWGAAGALKDAAAMKKAQVPLAMEYLAYNDPMAYSKFTAPSNDLWQFMGMRCTEGSEWWWGFRNVRCLFMKYNFLIYYSIFKFDFNYF